MNWFHPEIPIAPTPPPPPDYSDLLDTIGSNLAEINDTLNAILNQLEKQ